MPKKKLNTDATSGGLPSLARMVGYLAVKHLQRTDDRVKILSRLGYGTAEMAIICDVTPAAIATLMHRRNTKQRATS